MRVCWILFVAGLLAGCHGPPKRSAPSTRRSAERDDLLTPDNLNPRPVNTPATKGLLAGRVLDKFDRPVAKASIQVVELRGSGPAAAPFEYETDEKGNFLLRGLDADASYRLIARVKDGDHLQACTVEVRPNNPNVVICVSEDNAGPNTPPPPAVPVFPGLAVPKKDERRDPRPAASLGGPMPAPAPKPEPPPPPGPPGDNPSGELPPAEEARERRPDLRIEVPRRTPSLTIPPPSRTDLRPVPEVGPAAPYSAQPLPVPSCVMLTARRVDNFALQDLGGRGWEFRRDRKGRLFLLDFWHTRCPHCMPGIRHLNDLQQAYGARGLEVIGVACEQSGDADQRARQVSAVRSRFDVRYRILMAGDQGPLRPCPLSTQLGIAAFPTLKLIDENGNVVWESMGLSERQLYELKMEIERRLPLAR